MSIKNRISKRIEVYPRDLQKNDGNWRMHPMFQRSTVRGLIEEVGIVKPLMVYDSTRYGGLTLIDGHLRSDEFPDIKWPADLLDLSDEEADQILAMLDETTQWADRDPVKLDALVQKIKSSDAGVKAAVLRIKRQDAGAISAIKKLRGEENSDGAQTDEDTSDSAESASKKKFAYAENPMVRVAIPVSDIGAFEDAIKRTGIKNRGQALMALANHYLETVQ